MFINYIRQTGFYKQEKTVSCQSTTLGTINRKNSLLSINCIKQTGFYKQEESLLSINYIRYSKQEETVCCQSTTLGKQGSINRMKQFVVEL